LETARFDGVVNLYVIDDGSRLPIGNASVQIGTVTGRDGRDRLFGQRGHGRADDRVKAASYKSGAVDRRERRERHDGSDAVERTR